MLFNQRTICQYGINFVSARVVRELIESFDASVGCTRNI